MKYTLIIKSYQISEETITLLLSSGDPTKKYFVFFWFRYLKLKHQPIKDSKTSQDEKVTKVK
jgi:hypothetical protein